MNTTSPHRLARLVLASGGLLIVATASSAQPLSEQDRQRLDSGTIQESQRRADQAARGKKKVAPPEIESLMPKASTPLAGLRLTVQGLRIEGDARIPADALSAVLAPWMGRELNFPEFEQAAHAVANYLRSNGHPKAEVLISKAMMQQGGQVAVEVRGLSPKPADYAQAPAVEPRVQVQGFRFSGVTLATPEELQPLVAPWSGKALTVKELEQAAEAVAAHLRGKGYPLVQAWLPPQRVDQGVLEIAVREGVVDGSAGRQGIVVDGPGQRLRPEVVANVLSAGAPAGKPLRTVDLEQALLNANDYPGVKVRAQLAPGVQPGTTQVEAKVEEGRLATGSVSLDNYGSRYVGMARVNAALNLNSPTGYGDLLSLNAGKSSGMSSGKLAWVAPVGVRGTRVGLSYSQMRLDLQQDLTANNLNGSSSILSLFGSQPLVRRADRVVNLAFNVDAKRLENRLQGLGLSVGNDRRLDVASVSLSGEEADRWLGRNQWGATLGVGRANLGGNAAYQILDAATARTEGGFSKLNWNFARTAPVGQPTGPWSWNVSLAGQSASRNLDSAEKFQLGGPGGVRAYPVGEALGDNGLLANLELRHRVGSTQLGDATLFAFLDAGHVTQYRQPWAGALPGRPNSYSLYGWGLGASLIQGERGGVRAVVARKINDNPNPTAADTDSDGRTSRTRIWILGNIAF